MTGRSDSGRRLTPSEDGMLRRMFFFEAAGATLAPSMQVLKNELRARDQRSSVRAPELVGVGSV